VDEAGAIVGRTAELAAALDCVTRAAAGDPRVLLVTGPAGIGKTRLVQELCARITAQTGQVEVRIGESAPLAGASLPFGPFVAALDDHAECLLDEDASTAGAGADMDARRHILFVQTLRLLGNLAARAPLVMVLEDLHWADQSSRELLSFLAVRLRDQAVALVGTLRADELDMATGRWLAELERRPRVTALRLGSLPAADIAEVVADLLPASTGAERLSAVIAAAEGNPLYARELARSGPDRPPASVTAAVLSRVATLSRTARALVDQICVADGSLRHDLLAATTQLTERHLLSAIREAVGAGLLACTADGYAFGHSLIRQVVHAHLLPGERQRLHRMLAAALARVPDTDPGLLAQHWHLAGCPERAAPAALLAARQALSARAYPEATRSFELAIQLARWLPEPAGPLLETAAQAASWAKAPDLAVAWATAALASPSAAAPADQARLLERLGHYQWEMGDPRAAVAATEQAAALAEAEPPSALQARVFASLATRQLFLGDYDKACPLAERAVASACQTGATAEHARGLTVLGIVMSKRGDVTTGLQSLREASVLARQAGSTREIIHAASNHMYLLCTLGRFGEALDVAREGRQDALALGAPPSQLAIFGNNTAAILVATGRWQEADRLLAELLAEAPANMERYLRLLQLELAIGRGNDDQVGELAAILTKPPDDPRLTGAVLACLAEHALYGGDLAAAAAAVTAGLAAVTGADLADEEIRLLAAGAWLAAELAQLPPRARPRELGAGWDTLEAALAGRARAIADQHGASGPDLVAFGALVAAEDARRCGRDDRGAWRAVADAWRTAGQPYREAYARLREAAAAVSAGRRDQAARALTACESMARELPSEPLARLAAELTARARLPVQTAAVPRQRRSAMAATAQFDLTEREIQVLMLLTRGSSNREIARSLFISDRTVAVHVSRILAKLGVPNRAAAAAVGTRLDVADDADG
jgi:DNA-binding CsgD family transcriptional regulator/tetratricopeptide (TPR) repeat protein